MDELDICPRCRQGDCQYCNTLCSCLHEVYLGIQAKRERFFGPKKQTT